MVLAAYRMGYFPMADPRGRIGWYTSSPRAILELRQFHLPRRLARVIRRGEYEIRINTAFAQVIAGCATRSSTWISRRIVRVYTRLHEMGHAHSVEAWKDGQLAGGLYGLAMGGAFFGESMFYRLPDASKVCVAALVQRLREREFVLLDCQQDTAHMLRFGATVIPMDEYLRRLQQALVLPRAFAP